MRAPIAAFKLFILILICLITIPLIALSRVFLIKTRFFYIVPKLFHGSICRVFGIKYKIKGQIETNQQVLFVGNHLSYLDIPLLGSFLSATFISKEDVQGWPIFGLLATLAKTIFISRNPTKAEKALKQMNEAINDGTSLIVFPEGTSGSGKEVLPFKSSLFDIFIKGKTRTNMAIQTFTTAITKVDGHAINNESERDIYAWYGDMDLTPHMWTIAKTKGVELEVTFHPIRSLEAYDNRKTLSADCYNDVSSALTLSPLKEKA